MPWRGDVAADIDHTDPLLVEKHGSTAGLRRFVDEVHAVLPDAGGPAATIVATADTIISAFERAALGAIVAITLILLLALRRVRDVAMVLAPLTASAQNRMNSKAATVTSNAPLTRPS